MMLKLLGVFLTLAFAVLITPSLYAQSAHDELENPQAYRNFNGDITKSNTIVLRVGPDNSTAVLSTSQEIKTAKDAEALIKTGKFESLNASKITSSSSGRDELEKTHGTSSWYFYCAGCYYGGYYNNVAAVPYANFPVYNYYSYGYGYTPYYAYNYYPVFIPNYGYNTYFFYHRGWGFNHRRW